MPPRTPFPRPGVDANPPDIPSITEYLKGNPKYQSTALGGDGVGGFAANLLNSSGSFVALLATVTALLAAALVWVAYRYFTTMRRGGDENNKKKKNTVESSINNAFLRAKGVAVWLKSIRYVSQGLTDDHHFKQLTVKKYSTPSTTSNNNPFIVKQEEQGSSSSTSAAANYDAMLSGYSQPVPVEPEQHLAIIIGVDDPPSNTATSAPPLSVHNDCEQLSQLFAHASYFGSRYKTVTFTSKSIAPSQTNLAEVLQQLAESHRRWRNIVVYISAPARAYPREFIDSSLLRTEATDLSSVDCFARRRKKTAIASQTCDADDGGAASAPTESSTMFCGGVGVEFLAVREDVDDITSWVDVGLLLDRIRSVTRRSDDDIPITCLLDLHFREQASEGWGLTSSMAWLNSVDAMPVRFDQSATAKPPSRAKPVDADKESDPLNQLIVTKEELKKFSPDESLITAIHELDLNGLLTHALQWFEQLSVVALCCGDAQRVALGRQPVSSWATSLTQRSVAVSRWCDALLRGYHAATSFSPIPSPFPGMMDEIHPAMSLDPFSGLPSVQPHLPQGGGGVRGGDAALPPTVVVPAATGDVTSTLFHRGVMSTDSILHYLQHHAATLQDVPTFFIRKSSTNATFPSVVTPVLLVTQVAMMPRPLHCKPLISNRMFLCCPEGEALVNSVLRLLHSCCNNISINTQEGEETAPFVLQITGCGPKSDLIRSVAWHNDTLRMFANNVVYFDCRDMLVVNGNVKSWFVEWVNYLSRATCVVYQVVEFEEALDMFVNVFYHPEAKYLIIIDHCADDIRDLLLDGVVPRLSLKWSKKAFCSCMLIVPSSHVDISPMDLHSAIINVPMPSAKTLANCLVSTSGVHVRSEAGKLCAAELPSIVDRIILKSQAYDHTLDAMPLLQYWARRDRAQHFALLTEWEMGDLASATVEHVFQCSRGGADSTTNQWSHPSAARRSAAVHSEIALQRLKVLQATLLAPKLVPHIHPRRVPIQLVRMIAILSLRMSASQFVATVAELVEWGVLLSEYASYASSSTARSTFSEDAHAAMLDASVYLRVNDIICQHRVASCLSSVRLPLPEDKSASTIKGARVGGGNEEQLSSMVALEQWATSVGVSAEGEVGGSVISTAAVLRFYPVEALRLSLFSALVPFITQHQVVSGVVESSVVVNTLALAGALPVARVVQDVPLTSEFNRFIKDACQPWFLHAALQFASPLRLVAALDAASSLLNTMRTHHLASVDAINDSTAAARALEEAIQILKRNVSPIFRNNHELWTFFTLETESFRAEQAMATPVLYVEPENNATDRLPDAFDGALLICTSITSVPGFDTHGPAVTAMAFALPDVVVVGREDGSICIVDIKSMAVLSHVASDASGHDGAPITDLLFCRRSATATETSSSSNISPLQLITCSRGNRRMCQWSNVLDLNNHVVLEKLDVKQDRVYFPLSRKHDVLSQDEHTQLHRFHAQLVRCGSSPTHVARSAFGVGYRREDDNGEEMSKRQQEENSLMSSDHAKAVNALLLRFGLPDMHRGGDVTDLTAAVELNPVFYAHAHGVSPCCATFSLVELNDASCCTCGADDKGHLIVVVGTRLGKLWKLRMMKEA